MDRARRTPAGRQAPETSAAGRGAQPDRRAGCARALPGFDPVALRALGLTRRDLAVLDLVARGDTNAGVAGRLRISPLTVKKDLERMYGATGVGSRAELVALAWELAPSEGASRKPDAGRARPADDGSDGHGYGDSPAMRRAGQSAQPARTAGERRSADHRRLPGFESTTLGVLGLSRREVAVLEPVAEGRTNEEIAASLGLSPLTVKKHLERMSVKLGVSHRAALVAAARQRLSQGPGARVSGGAARTPEEGDVQRRGRARMRWGEPSPPRR